METLTRLIRAMLLAGAVIFILIAFIYICYQISIFWGFIGGILFGLFIALSALFCLDLD